MSLNVKIENKIKFAYGIFWAQFIRSITQNRIADSVTTTTRFWKPDAMKTKQVKLFMASPKTVEIKWESIVTSDKIDKKNLFANVIIYSPSKDDLILKTTASHSQDGRIIVSIPNNLLNTTIYYYLFFTIHNRKVSSVKYVGFT